jgi:two-component system cell cycle sensor histidine kinase/response regulator CckA
MAAGLMSRKLRYPVAVVLLAAVYFASAKVGLLAAVAQPVVSSAWPPAGVALAALLLFPVRLWPGIAIGAFLLNATAGVPLAGAAGIAVGNTLEAVLGALLLRRVAHFRMSLERLQDVLALALAAVASTPLSATIGVASLWLSGAIPAAAYWPLWLVWWSGDSIGILIVTPLLLAWVAASRIRKPLPVGRAFEASALFLTLAALTIALFRSPVDYAYAVFPVAGWAAVRFGIRGIASATFLVACIAIWCTVLGLGPFAGATPTENLFLLQTFIALLATTGLVLAAVTSERGRAEKALEESEWRYRDLAAFAPIGIYRSTRQGRLLEVNNAFVRLLGYETAAQVLELDIEKQIYFDSADRERLIAEMESRDGPADSEVRLRRRGGSPTWVRLHSRAIRGTSGRIECIDGFVHDIQRSKTAEEALRQSEERFSLAFHASPVATSISEVPSGRFLDINEEFLRVLGFQRDEVVGHSSLDLGIWVNPIDRGQATETLQAGRGLKQRETLVRTKSGEIRTVIGSMVMVEMGRVPCMLSTFNDITEHKRAQDGLSASEERYRLLFENNPQPMWVFDDETQAFLAVNEAACRHYGYSRAEFLSMTIRDIRPADELPRLIRHLSETRENLQANTWRHRRKDGTVIDAEVTAYSLVFDGRPAKLVLAIDVTERRRLEQQLRQAQKMEAIGRLAGGVAHDFNNVLTAILGYADLLGSGIGEADESIAEIKKAGERAASLTRQLLAFSRQQVLEPKVLDVNALVENVEKMLRRLIGEDVKLVTALEPSVWNARADAGQLEQVIMNLAVNARDAMPKGGTLTIETKNAELDDVVAQDLVTMRAGRYVMLAVTDTGVGMNAETKSHIFEPFFTTKGIGKGTGLGLATVYGIVKQSDGYVWVYSEPGLGTSFKIYLPRVDEALDDTASRRPMERPARGSETVLLVEDEDAVRTLTRKLLKSLGYTVLEVSDGSAALEIAQEHAGPIHLLLTDVVMPDLGGAELAARMAALRPETKVLFMSGYTDDAIIRHGLIHEGGRLLQKPFTAENLARKLREVLETKPA